MDDPFAATSDLLPFARHGGDLAAATACFPRAPRPWLDLSTGINPHAFPLPDIPAVAWTRLPDAAALAELEARAATVYRAGPADAVVAAPGTQAIIQRLPSLVAGARRVAVLGPTYAEHAAVWRAAGADVETVGDLASLGRADVAVVVNPNNPDGRLVPVDDLCRVADRLAARGGLLVVDEAFADLLDPGCSLVPGGVPAGTVVLRSFGKVFGLAGVRLGFLVGAPQAARRIRAALGPWAVPGPAIVIGRAALADDGWLARTRDTLSRAGAALDAVLDAAGFEAMGGTPLFRLARHPQAARRFHDLAEAGILVRPFAQAPLLRFGVPAGMADLQRLAAALDVRVDGPRSSDGGKRSWP